MSCASLSFSVTCSHNRQPDPPLPPPPTPQPASWLGQDQGQCQSGSRTCSTGRACLSARLQVDGAGRWAATCSVLPGDSTGAAWLLWGSFLALFKKKKKSSILCQCGAIISHLIHSGEAKLRSGVGEGRGRQRLQGGPRPRACAHRSRPKGNVRTRSHNKV